MTVASPLASALAHHRVGDLAGARVAYRQAIALEPADVDALNGCGARDLAGGAPRAAMRFLGRASALSPADVRVVVNLCLAASELGVATPGMAMRALALAPVMPALMDLLSMIRGKAAEQIVWLKRAIAIEPSAHRLLQLGLRLGRVDREMGARILRRAVAHHPADADVLNSAGSHLYEGGSIVEGARLFLRALACRPLHAAAWSNMALACHDQGQLAVAIRAARRALALEPSLDDAHANLANASLEAVSPSSAVKAHRRALATAPGRSTFVSNLLMAMAYVSGAAATQAKLAKAWWSRGPRRGGSAVGERKDRLRIGYVSTFALASTRHLGLSAIARHDPGEVEVFAYVQSRRGTPADIGFGPAFAGRRELAGLEDEAAARTIRADGIDVLVDLSGHTPGNRLGVFALKPAPVQVTWIESFFTTGLPAIDWFLTDEDHSPEGMDQHLVERPFRLDRPRFCYAPPSDAPAVTAPPSARDGFVRFGCFNYPPKIGDEVVEAWAGILRDVPGSRLRLKWWSMAESAAAAIMKRRFASAGVAADRLELAGASPHRDMLAEYGDIDIALDPFPFTGGVTTCEALWMGVPVVTLCGRAVIERQSAALLRSIGAGDLVAADIQAYRRIAATLAADDALRGGHRTGLRDAMASSPLTDADDMARKLESAFRRMVALAGKEDMPEKS